MSFTQRLSHAFKRANELHATQTRKGTDVPYLTHLMAVAALVGEYGGDEDLVIAALLHDAVEDQGGVSTLTAIRTEFGEHIAKLVEAASDTDEVPKPPWRARKEAHIAKIRNAAPDLRLLVAADKLHNVTTLARDCEADGIATLDRFNGGREGTLWFYRAIHEALANNWKHPILDELYRGIVRLHEAAGVTLLPGFEGKE